LKQKILQDEEQIAKESKLHKADGGSLESVDIETTQQTSQM